MQTNKKRLAIVTPLEKFPGDAHGEYPCQKDILDLVKIVLAAPLHFMVKFLSGQKFCHTTQNSYFSEADLTATCISETYQQHTLLFNMYVHKHTYTLSMIGGTMIGRGVVPAVTQISSELA